MRRTVIIFFNADCLPGVKIADIMLLDRLRDVKEGSVVTVHGGINGLGNIVVCSWS